MLGATISPLLPSPNRKTLTLTLAAALLLLLSFLAGVYRHPRPQLSRRSSCPPAAAGDVIHDAIGGADLDFIPVHTAAAAIPVAAAGDVAVVPFCSANFTDYCPCQDPHRERQFTTRDLVHRERHCPGPEERLRCRVPRPEGYRSPVRWPESRNYVWFKNVPSKRLTVAKADQNWVRLEGERLVFPGGGTSFSKGVKGYVAEMAKLVPLRTGEVRTALDLGCGVASFGGHLLDYNILTVSVAPRDVHEAQVQFALERGLPAMLGVLSVHRLPYPSRSFDMAHCARCLIPWTNHDGLYMLEIDRILRPGGYWVLSGPPIYWRRFYKGWKRTPQDLEAEQTAIEDLGKRFCWKKIVEKGSIAVWRKPSNHVHCAKKSKILKSPPFCKGTDPDAVWNEEMETCITPLPPVESTEEASGGALQKWPKRLNVVPPRITRGTVNGLDANIFNHENKIWEKRVAHYGHYFSFSQGGKYRNIMDMNAGVGGFAAAMSKFPVWVMNVIPVSGTNNTLGIIFERGLIGTYMDWCEAFSTYPRTYDLLHAHGLFSIYMNNCDIMDVLLEMDRILRPEGTVIIRDHVDVIVKVKEATERLSWPSRIVHSEKGPFDPEKLLLVDNSLAVNKDKARRK